MDPASSATNIAANAADACRQIWQLGELWHDAPKDISHLRDELAEANDFFRMVQLAVAKHSWIRTADWVGQLTGELEECLHKAAVIVRQIQTSLNRLLDVSLSYGVDLSNKRRRALWLRSHEEIDSLRSRLKEAKFQICSVLAILDSPVAAPAVDISCPVVGNMAKDAGRSTMISKLPITQADRIEAHPVDAYGVNGMVLVNGNEGTPLHHQRTSASHALERYQPEWNKSRWEEHKHLPGLPQATTTLQSSVSRNSCADTCICACHSAVKNWGRWALHGRFLGTVMISYRGVARRRIACSSPRCHSGIRSQERLFRMDIQPSMWLLRATVSVFLAFGLPNPELVIRVHKVTEVTDVHSPMNQLLWALQRGEMAGVKHFLQSRLVQADDLYGDPVNGFTPMRLALDRKLADVALLLYHSGGFHGTLEGSAASSLLLWLEQDPSAADFLAEHFPLSAIIDSADYTTLHKIILGLRHHLCLHAYLATPEGRAQVNTPNTFGRTPLHVAALRGDAAAVAALLDAGADLAARGNHAKHALHYACKAGSIAAVDALLARGASLQVRDSRNRTPLFDLVGYGSNTNPELVTHLLAHGIVADPADWVTATLLALSNKRTAAVERLLPYWPPAHELPLYPAIHIGSPDGVRLLLARGADYRTIDAFGEGILHWLAGSGLEMLRLFKAMGLCGVAVGRRDNRGKTAMEIMEARWDLTDEFRREFLELLDWLGDEGCEDTGSVMVGGGEVAEIDEKNESKGGDGDEDSSEDEFFDAVEALTSPPHVLEQQNSLRSPAEEEEEPPFEPGDSAAAEQLARHRDSSESADFGQEDVREQQQHSTHAKTDEYNSEFHRRNQKGHDTPHKGTELQHGSADEDFVHDSGSKQKYPESPRAEKTFIDETELKFLGTSDALRGQ